MIILGIDFGSRKIGLAYSDETALIAAPLPTVKVKTLTEAVNKVKQQALQQRAEKIVLGWPTSISGKDTPEMLLIKKFKSSLEKLLHLPIDYWDESYSTKQAEYHARGRKRANSDSEAARIILQEYLDYQHTK